MIEHRNLKYWENEIIKYSNNVEKVFAKSSTRVELTEALLKGLRNFVTSVECYVFKTNKNESYPSRYQEIDKANSYCKANSNLNFLSKFYDNLNASVGHQDFVGEYAERLGLKYIYQLIIVKDFLYKQFGIIVLEHLSVFPLDLDDSFQKYYEEILKALNKQDDLTVTREKGTYYVQKKKMIYIKNSLFYEYVFTNALDNNCKYDRFIAFSLLNIPTNYAIKAISVFKKITFFNQEISYCIVTDFNVSIRPCEIEKIAKILKVANNYSSKGVDYYRLMDYLKTHSTNLVNIVYKSTDEYNLFKSIVFINKETTISKILDSSRDIIISKQVGYKTILYLLYIMNNDVLNKQMPRNRDDSFDNLNLNKGVYAFEKAPFSSGLLNHNPSFVDLINIFDYEEHKTEILAKAITKMSNESSCIYIPKEKISNKDLNPIINQYNLKFNKESLQYRKIKEFGKYVFIAENEIDTINALTNIIQYSNEINFPRYEVYAESRIKQLNLKFDDEDKENAVKTLFEKGSIYVVYGAAGTGKSYFANYVLKILKDMNKVCIASTNPAVDNMKRKFEDESSQYLTVTKYLKEFNNDSKIDILIIDECSTIPTKQIYEILSQTKPKLIIMLGDIFQIQSITFGNWFALLRKFLPKRCFIDLKSQFRTESETLIDFWEDVRNIRPNIQEKLAMNEISSGFDESLFIKNYEDEIILCLNYDGLYGINNINKVLQNVNKNKAYSWKQYTFKVGDPIIFNDCIRYRDVFYNNLKGSILEIKEINNGFVFTIQVKRILDPMLCISANIELLSVNENKSIVRFTFNKFTEDIYDKDTGYNSSIPFQISYAMSIHKAQGLEYDSVKVIISNEVEENITHNMFYTAITRARKYLTIYWTPETENKIISSLNHLNYGVDASILKKRVKMF